MARERLGDLALVCVLAGLGVLVVLVDREPLGGPAWQVVWHGLGLVALALVPWRRRAPVAFALVAQVLAVVSLVAVFVPLAGVHGVARRCSTRVAAAVFVTGLVLAVLGNVVNNPSLEVQIDLSIASVTTHLAAFSTGLYARARAQLLESLRERAERAEADQEWRAEEARRAERRRIAGEMHDVLGHRLSLLSVHAGAMELRADLPPDRVRETAGLLRTTTQSALSDLRRIILLLREPVGEFGTGFAVDDLRGLDELAEQARSAGSPATVEIAEALHESPPPTPLCRTTYRIVQEGLTNARKHRPAASVRISVDGDRGRGLRVDVVTAPTGRWTTDSTGAGVGLIGLRERVVAVTGGELETHVDDRGEHHLHARMDWPSEEST